MNRVWVTFKINDRKLKAKTDTWEVWSLDEASHLGRIKWFAPWRQYCFFPAGGDNFVTVFEQDCLRVIAEFIETMTAKHRKGRRAFE